MRMFVVVITVVIVVPTVIIRMVVFFVFVTSEIVLFLVVFQGLVIICLLAVSGVIASGHEAILSAKKLSLPAGATGLTQLSFVLPRSFGSSSGQVDAKNAINHSLPHSVFPDCARSWGLERSKL